MSSQKFPEKFPDDKKRRQQEDNDAFDDGILDDEELRFAPDDFNDEDEDFD
ncbi:MAG: hypothetical protein HYW78_00130 [Parcubacteria group bacterium]|nr:hypothetical protein [Parcubacteria group bacterium]